MTTAQRLALSRYWERFGLPCEPVSWDQVFARRSECYVEIGFGMGDALVELAGKFPNRDYLGIEVYEPGIGRLLAQLASLDLTNVKVIRDDAVKVFEGAIPDGSLAGVLIFFPDPWPKKRHHKRRLIQPGFVARVGAKLKPEGELQLATDCESYAWHILEVIESDGGFENLAGPGRFAVRDRVRPVTKFERRGSSLGHPVWDLRFVRIDHPGPDRPRS